ncbi:MAG: hypothetical protein JNL70_06675 [Saprospiraceae bacterium]|nr:hypothetical protein [Saprospiraceae bacterium]
MKKSESKPDLLWKDLFTEFNAEFIHFFLGKKLHSSIDFSVKPEFLEQELNETFAANEPQKKITDKIVRYKLKNGQYRFLIVHIEFQGKSEKNFSERMFRYFVYIYLKYGTIEITALALYTGFSRPKDYNAFKVSMFGTQLHYEFNTYTVREQDEQVLMKSDNPFAIAVLASLYLIKAGKDVLLRLSYKKKLIEIARKKDFDFAKLFRLINFVGYLVTLPRDLELEYTTSTFKPIIQEKMKFSRAYIETYANVLGISEILEEIKQDYAKEALEKGMEKGMEKGIERGREELIMNIYNKMGFNALQISNMTDLSVSYIQSIIDKHTK